MDTRIAIHALSRSVIAIFMSRYNTRIAGPSIGMHRCIVGLSFSSKIDLIVLCQIKDNSGACSKFDSCIRRMKAVALYNSGQGVGL